MLLIENDWLIGKSVLLLVTLVINFKSAEALTKTILKTSIVTSLSFSERTKVKDIKSELDDRLQRSSMRVY